MKVWMAASSWLTPVTCGFELLHHFLHPGNVVGKHQHLPRVDPCRQSGQQPVKLLVLLDNVHHLQVEELSLCSLYKMFASMHSASKDTDVHIRACASNGCRNACSGHEGHQSRRIACLMSSFAAPTSPTVTRTGEVRASRTSFSTFVGMVAENSSVCRSGLTWPMIDRTCSHRCLRTQLAFDMLPSSSVYCSSRNDQSHAPCKALSQATLCF